MRRHYNNPDDYAYDYAHAADCGCATCNPGYRHNPTQGAQAEAESQRVMAIVQYVADELFDNPDLTKAAIRAAKRAKKLKGLIDDALSVLEPLGLTKKQLEAAESILKSAENADIISVDQVYYTSEVSAEELLIGGSVPGKDPGVVLDGNAFEDVMLRSGASDLQAYKEKLGKTIVVKLSYNMRGDRTRPRPFKRTFLKKVWPYVTDDDVRNAVSILQQRGVSFLRKKAISSAEFYKGSVEEQRALGTHRYFPGAARNRREFLTAYAARTLGDTVLHVNMRAVAEALAKIDFGPDDVVYRYAGTNDTIAGASAQGFYVAKLRPGQLTLEGLSPPSGLGICVGGAHYRERVEAGRMSIYSIRTPAGRPKLTVETRIRRKEEIVHQVKGAANRLPGFLPNSFVFNGAAGVDDVRVLVEFLRLHLRLYAEDMLEVTDLRPGLLAMQRVGIDPFLPPVKGQTWEKAQAALDALRAEYMQALRALRIAENKADFDAVNAAHDHVTAVADKLDATGAFTYKDFLEMARQIDLEFQRIPQYDALIDLRNAIREAETPEQRRAAQERLDIAAREAVGGLALPPAVWPPRENPDPLAYTDPEVAALAREAFAHPMGGRWTYDQEIEGEVDE